MNRFEVYSEVENFIDSIALQNLRRISPHYVAQQVGVSSVDIVFDAMMRLVNFKLTIKYEPQCTECGTGQKPVSSLHEIRPQLTECRYCHEEFIPTEDKVWVVFDITEEFKEFMKESARSYQHEASQGFTQPGGISLEEAKKNQVFLDHLSFSSRWKIDPSLYNALLQEVIDAPSRAKAKEISTRQQGDTLEKLIKYIYDGAPTVFRYLGKEITHTSEMDGIAEVLYNVGFMAKWPPYVINEAKNWSVPVDKDNVDVFVSKVRRANVHVGVYFSRVGITGEKDHSAARAVIDSARSQDDIVILLFTLRDLEKIQQGHNFLDLIETKYRTQFFTRS